MGGSMGEDGGGGSFRGGRVGGSGGGSDGRSRNSLAPDCRPRFDSSTSFDQSLLKAAR